MRKNLGRRNRSQIRVQLEDRSLGKNQSSLDDVLELPNVAGPRVADEPFRRRRRDALYPFTEIAGISRKEKHSELRNIGTTLTQRGHFKRENVQSVIEIRAETAGANRLLKISICSGDDPHVNTHRTAATDRLELAFLQNAQQLNLSLQRQLTHFVQEDCASVGELEAADVPPKGTGESTLHMPKEFALYQTRRDGTTVYLYQRTILTRAPVVNGPRDEFLPSPCLSINEHTGVGGRDLVDSSQKCEQGWATAHDLLEVVLGADLLLKIDILFLKPCF